MKRIDIYFINKPSDDRFMLDSLSNNRFMLDTSKGFVQIIINIKDLSNYEICNEISKVNDMLKIYDKIKRINIICDPKLEIIRTNHLLTKLHDIIYKYYPITRDIKLYMVNEESNSLMVELTKYKDIVMDPNKTPDSYLKYVQENIPENYQSKIFNLKDTKLFPLTKAVGQASVHSSFFVHVSPKRENKGKNIYLVGKAITYDSGGMNLKKLGMEEMKIDMTGSAIILSVLKLLSQNKLDEKLNIHLLLPIVENMIGPNSTKPGMVVESMNNKKVEIVNTDAEGRLCIADGIEYVQKYLMTTKNPENCLILDIATLTGNTNHITSGVSSLSMCNQKGSVYLDNLLEIGEDIGEYLDFLKIRKEYLDLLSSPVADIKNTDLTVKAGCIVGGTFLNYFVDEKVPWIHIDLGVSTFVNSVTNGYGINLLYQFIKKIDNQR